MTTATAKMLARKDGRIATMTFNNPAKHNAVSLDMWEAGTRILEDFAKDDAVRVVIVTGSRRQGLRLRRRHLALRG